MSAPVEKYHHPIAGRRDWETPPELFAQLHSIYQFTLDACATKENAKCALYFTPREQCPVCWADPALAGSETDACTFCDGLSQSWGEHVVWMNPPYGREIGAWMKKAYESSLAGATVVCLVPARTDSGWWHDYAMRGEIEFLRGRVKFVGAPYNAPFPCAVVTFHPTTKAIAA